MKIIITEQQYNLILLSEISKKDLEEYLNKVEEWNDIYNTNGVLITKQDEDFKWLKGKRKIKDFYRDTDYHKKRFDSIVEKWNKIYDEEGKLISALIPGTKEPNEDYSWLKDNKKLGEFYKATNHEKKENEGFKYGFKPSSATVDDVVNFIKSRGYKSRNEFLRDKLNGGESIYTGIPKNIRQTALNIYFDPVLETITEKFKKKYNLPKISEWVYENFEKFINENNIVSRKNLEKVAFSVWEYAKHFGFLDKFFPDTLRSTGERIVNKILGKKEMVKGEDYLYNQKVSDCKNEKGCTLMPDFILLNYKGREVWIEYDGEQHFIPKKLYGGIEGLKPRIKNDIAKNNFCGKKIKMIRISYKTNTYDDILKEIDNGLKSRKFLYLSENYPELGWNDPRLKDDPEMNYLYDDEKNNKRKFH